MLKRIFFMVIVSIVLCYFSFAWGVCVDMGGIQSGEPKTSYLNSPDSHCYTFSGDAGDHVVITTGMISGSVAPEIYLYPPDGGPLEASNPGSAFGHTLDYQLLQSGLYTIVISDYGLNSSGDYGASFVKTPPDLRQGIYNPSPANGTTVFYVTGSFGWDSVAEATGYDLYFGEGVVAPLVMIGDNLPSPSMSFPSLESGLTYLLARRSPYPGGRYSRTLLVV
ncbi:MAG: hypothetical protein HZC48_12910 [Nitrospirae bacterium]|nr:hypothetical protein [Nitrospirota bacterium]